jgi:serine/threonine-protein kinase
VSAIASDAAFEDRAAGRGGADEGTLRPGTVLQGTYLVVAKLASGGMGEIHLAHHVRLPGKFAIKVLGPALARRPEAIARFCREAAVVSVLRHPNVVQVYDFDVTPDGVPFLVMECLEGVDLAERLADEGPLPVAAVGRIVRQVAGALAAAHARGIVHRDLKPGNVVLLDVEGQPDFVKVLDFGISKIAAGGPQDEPALLGTPAFMAPEQAERRGDAIDGRTDQFSLAAVAYTLLTGRVPFEAPSAEEVLAQVVAAEPPPLGSLVDGAAAGVDAVIRRALAKAPGARFPRVLDFASALDAAILALGPAADVPPRRALAPRRPAGKGGVGSAGAGPDPGRATGLEAPTVGDLPRPGRPARLVRHGS